MKNLLFILFSISLILSCNFKKDDNLTEEERRLIFIQEKLAQRNQTTKESKPNITYERGYGPKLIEYVWEGDRRSEKYDMNDSVLNYERIYINGVLGSSTEFYGTGNLWFKTQYEDGLRHGNHFCYNEDGKTLKYTQVYENDSLIRKIKITYFENGQLQSEITTKNGISNGLTILYHKNGKIRTKGFLNNSEAYGVWSNYYENGKLRTEGEYKDGKPTGIWKYYEEDGQFVKQSKYLNGDLIEEKWNYKETNDLGVLDFPSISTFVDSVIYRGCEDIISVTL